MIRKGLKVGAGLVKTALELAKESDSDSIEVVIRGLRDDIRLIKTAIDQLQQVITNSRSEILKLRAEVSSLTLKSEITGQENDEHGRRFRRE